MGYECPPPNGGETRSPEEAMRGDKTKKSPGPRPVPEGSTTEPGNPGAYPVGKGDPGSEGY